MRFTSKYTPDELVDIRRIVNGAANKKAGYALAAAAYDTSKTAIRSVLGRAEGRWGSGTKGKGRIHIVIPDCQVRPGVPTDHLTWAGRHIVDKYYGEDVAIICLGDFWDTPSLSSYDKGKKSMEGRRYIDDIAAGNAAFALLNAPLEERGWKPERHFLLGNHENRITVAIENDAQLEGALSLDSLNTRGWTVHPFLEPVEIDGILYAHYFVNSANGRPLAGYAETRLKHMGRSFSQGHQQGLQVANRSVLGKRTRAIIAGSFYQHSESYRGPQGQDEWRGILVKHNVHDGDYDLMEVSLDYLRRRYG